MAKLLFLGTGGSMGVPVIGCKCEVCSHGGHYNQRKRTAAYVEIDDQHFLIDVGPDFRSQALMYGIDHIDAVLLTHTHFDHIAGIDELRIFNFLQKKPLPTLLSASSFEDLQKRYFYLFQTGDEKASATAKLDCRVLEKDFGEVSFEGVDIAFTSYWQMGMQVNGYRFGELAYLTDVQRYDEKIFEFLKGVKTLVLSALRYRDSPFHLTIAQAIAFAQKVGAERTFFTHLDHEVEHDTVNAKLPQGIELAYDGLEIEFNYGR
ncbi:MAG: MBL fold metallo-hydrolase [Chlamydiales bacterium]|nr:MBL fold metallo-hydrolase [Chlamydiales bacterium]